MSPSTKNGLSNFAGYHIEHRGEIEVKGKGMMHTYFLLGRDGFYKSLPNPADYVEVPVPQQNNTPPRPVRSGASNEMDTVKFGVKTLIGRRSSLDQPNTKTMCHESSHESPLILDNPEDKEIFHLLSDKKAQCSKGIDNPGFTHDSEDSKSVKFADLDMPVSSSSSRERHSSGPGGILKRSNLKRQFSIEEKQTMFDINSRKKSRGRKYSVEFTLQNTSLEDFFKSPKGSDPNNLVANGTSHHGHHLSLDMNNILSVIRPGKVVDKISDSKAEAQKSIYAKLQNTEHRNSPPPLRSSSPKPDLSLLKAQVNSRMSKAMQITPL